MTKEEFYTKLLEAQIRGMLLDTYETNDRLTPAEREVFFVEIFERGFFRKNDGTGEKYDSFAEMLTDLRAGKKVLNLALPNKRPGYFSFPENPDSLYDEFNANNADALDPNALSIRDSFQRGRREPVILTQSRLAPGEEPPVPGGFLSSLWNRVVKRFRGHSSAAWKEYDRYQEERRMQTVLENAADDYTNIYRGEPGTARDSFIGRVYSVNQAGRIKRGEEAPPEVRHDRLPGEERVLSPEELLERNIQEMMDAQHIQERDSFNRKMRQINDWDSDIFKAFQRGEYDTVDAAYAAALDSYEKGNWNQLNNDAHREIKAKQAELTKSIEGEIEVLDFGPRERLLEAHAYEINKFLSAKKNDPAFKAKVDAEAQAMESRCRDIENVYLYENVEEFNKYDISMKLALQELNIDGADQYKCLTDQRYEKKKEERDRRAPAPEPDNLLQLAEEHLNAGTVTEEEMELLLEEEDTLLKDFQRIDESQGKFQHLELNPYRDIEYDLSSHGLSRNTLQDQILTLKIMRYQREALKDQPEAPFLFRTADQASASIEKAYELKFIDEKTYQRAKKTVKIEEPEELPSLEELAAKVEEDEKSEAEEEIRDAQNEANRILKQKQSEKEEFLADCMGNEKFSNVLNEYRELSRMIEEARYRGDSLMKELGEKAGKSLDRALDAKFGIYQYKPETAVEDVANLIALKEMQYDQETRQRFEHNPKDAYSRIVLTVKHNNLQTPLLQDPPMVDSLLLGDNPKRMPIDQLYHEAEKYAEEQQKEAAKHSVEERLKGYSEAQRKLLQDQRRMDSIQYQVASVEPLRGGMAREEEDLRLAAQRAMGSLNNYLAQPQDFGSQMSAEELVDNMATVAMYQSLKNRSYRQAYRDLLGHSKRKELSDQLKNTLKGKYREMIVNQIHATGFVPQIIADRAKLADTVFGEQEEFFTYVEKYNLGSGVSFQTFADSEMESLVRQAKGNKEQYDKVKKSKLPKAEKTAAKAKYDQATADLKEQATIMKDVCASIKTGAEASKQEIERRRNQEYGLGLNK